MRDIQDNFQELYGMEVSAATISAFTDKVMDMAGEEACESDIIVTIRFGDRILGVPLAQLEPTTDDPAMIQAIRDWHYWDGRGYSF